MKKIKFLRVALAVVMVLGLALTIACETPTPPTKPPPAGSRTKTPDAVEPVKTPPVKLPDAPGSPAREKTPEGDGADTGTPDDLEKQAREKQLKTERDKYLSDLDVYYKKVTSLEAESSLTPDEKAGAWADYLSKFPASHPTRGANPHADHASKRMEFWLSEVNKSGAPPQLGLGQNAEKWEKEAKSVKVKVLEKNVYDLTVQDMDKVMAVIETDAGIIKLKFHPQQAPTHVKNFIMLAEKGFYNGVIFHRVIPGFMIQGGDPEGTGRGGPGWTIAAEFNELPHNKGTLSAARTNDPNSAGSQFFICLERTPHLDRKYSVFGDVIEGLDTVDKIGATKTGGANKPADDQVMKKVTIELIKN